MKRTIVLLVALASVATTVAAQSAQRDFVKAWRGQFVVLKTPLYSLVFNERGKLGNTRRNLREGLLVVTPAGDGYFQFDGRQGRNSVKDSDPERLVGTINREYVGDSLDVRSYRKVEPLVINRFDPGVELEVSAARVDGDEITLEFVQPGGKEVMTSLRIKWPVPLSPSFTEREPVEKLISQFVAIKQL
jgi:hypothetical protein